MKLTSTAFQNDEYIPQTHTCDGDNINPPLSIENVPERIMPSGEFYHWVVFNIDPETLEISENTEPDGVCARGDANGNCGYYGPCPPGEEHRYFFIVYALDAKLDLDEGVSYDEVLQELEDTTQLARAELLGRYER